MPKDLQVRALEEPSRGEVCRIAAPAVSEKRLNGVVREAEVLLDPEAWGVSAGLSATWNPWWNGPVTGIGILNGDERCRGLRGGLAMGAVISGPQHLMGAGG